MLCLAVGKWAFGALLAQSVLLVVAHALGTSTVSAVKVLAAVTLFELAMRQPGAAWPPRRRHWRSPSP
ncbi:hypothetical protein ACFQ3Z_03050 [Streptomyces nogalater]